MAIMGLVARPRTAGLADSLDEVQGGVLGGVAASAFAERSRRDMLNLSLSAYDPYLP
jgi:hypothetical protein